MDLSGGWVGVYKYSTADVHAPVSFRLDLVHSRYFRISGTVKDGEGGMPEIGEVSGWLLGTHIRFKKRMPVCWVVDEGKALSLNQYVAAKFGGSVPDIEHPAILYKGVVSEDGRTASGVWRMSGMTVPILADGRSFSFAAVVGTWTAERAGS